MRPKDDAIRMGVVGRGGRASVIAGVLANSTMQRRYPGISKVAVKFSNELGDFDQDSASQQPTSLSAMAAVFRSELMIMGTLCVRGHNNLVQLVGFFDTPAPRAIMMKRYKCSLKVGGFLPEIATNLD